MGGAPSSWRSRACTPSRPSSLAGVETTVSGGLHADRYSSDVRNDTTDMSSGIVIPRDCRPATQSCGNGLVTDHNGGGFRRDARKADGRRPPVGDRRRAGHHDRRDPVLLGHSAVCGFGADMAAEPLRPFLDARHVDDPVVAEGDEVLDRELHGGIEVDVHAVQARRVAGAADQGERNVQPSQQRPRGSPPSEPPSRPRRRRGLGRRERAAGPPSCRRGTPPGGSQQRLPPKLRRPRSPSWRPGCRGRVPPGPAR